jgi:uncharacterized protein YndB with AHSA1/START domain
VSAVRRQALVTAPIESVWELVGNPARYPEWWPRVVEVSGERFEQGEEYVQVTKRPVGSIRTTMQIDQLEGLSEIGMTCQDTGAFARWQLTGAADGTFVEVELGMLPKTLTDRVMDGMIGRVYFSRWADQSLDGLRRFALVSSPRAS